MILPAPSILTGHYCSGCGCSMVVAPDTDGVLRLERQRCWLCDAMPVGKLVDCEEPLARLLESIESKSTR